MTAIREFSEATSSAWDDYVDRHPRGTIFHLRGWQGAVERTFGHTDASLYADRGGEIVGVLPLMEVPTLKGRALVSVPYAVYGGMLADDREIETALLGVARQRAVTIGAKYIEMRSRDTNGLGLPENDLYVTFERQLPDRPEDCLGLIPRKSRASVRNGRSKFGVRSEFTDDYARLYDLYALNVRRLGSPTFPFRFLVELQQAFEGRIDVQNTVFEDRVVASVMSFYYKETVIPYYSGTDDNSATSRARSRASSGPMTTPGSPWPSSRPCAAMCRMRWGYASAWKISALDSVSPSRRVCAGRR